MQVNLDFSHLQILIELGSKLNISKNFEDVLQEITDVAAELTKSNGSSILLFEEETHQLYFAAARAENREELLKLWRSGTYRHRHDAVLTHSMFQWVPVPPAITHVVREPRIASNPKELLIAKPDSPFIIDDLEADAQTRYDMAHRAPIFLDRSQRLGDLGQVRNGLLQSLHKPG